MTRLMLDEIIDPSEARVVVTRDAAGRVTDARFDMTGLPRVDSMLVGRPVAEVPALVEHLCGICPAAHHLAGIRAVEALWGVRPPVAAQFQRRLLNAGSVLSGHAMSLLIASTSQTDGKAQTDQATQDAMTLRRFAKATMAAAGSPGHFPATAIPGGVAAPVSPEARARCQDLLDDALAAALRIAHQATKDGDAGPGFPGADVALVDEDGHPDLSGEYLRAVAPDGATIIPSATADAWDQLIAEAVPGDPAPRPYLIALGPEHGTYRVGPVAQLKVGPLRTPLAAGLQQTWLRTYEENPQTARAIVTLYAVETIGDLLARPELLGSDIATPLPERWRAGTGVGWVDGSRGLLVHRYAADEAGRVTSATILTPTAQNERWLAHLLRLAVDTSDAQIGAEEAIREADPCLPCVTAPPGRMGLVIDTVFNQEGR